MKIKFKLMIIMGLLLVLACVLLSSVFYLVSEEIVHKQMDNQVKSIAVLKQNQLNRFINKEIQNIRSVSGRYLLPEKVIDYSLNKNDENRNEILKIISSEHEYNNDLSELFVIDLNGVVLASTDSLQEGKIKYDEDYFQNALIDFHIQNFHYDVSSNEPVMVIAVPLKYDDVSIVGVVAAKVNINEISNLMLETSGLGETGETFLVNKYNYVMTDLKKESDKNLKTRIHTQAVDLCLAGNSGHLVAEDYVGDRAHINYYWLDNLQTCMIVKIDENELFMRVRNLRYTLLFSTIIVLLGGMIFVLLFSHKLTNPLKKLMIATSNLKSGKLNTPIDIKSKDEFQDLGKEFKEMAKALKKYKNDLEKYNKDLEKEVESRTKDLINKNEQLEKFSKFSVGRELKMVELKKKIESLNKELKKKKTKK